MPTRADIHVIAGRFDEAVSKGLHALLADDDELVMVATDVPLGELATVVARHRVEVALVDLDALPAIRDLRRLSARLGDVRIVVLADAPTPGECRQALMAGASACLPKETAARDVRHAVHLAARGLRVLPRPASDEGGTAGAGELSEQEAAVLAMLREGHSSAETATRLGMEPDAVRMLARRIRRKLGAGVPPREPPVA
jgi:DNA-binding NarL/FixJ family response regulator